MDYFKIHLRETGKISSSEIPRYVHWVSRCYEFCHKPQGAPLGNHQVDDFITVLGATQPENLVQEAARAIATYRYLYHQVVSDADGRAISFENDWGPLLARFAQTSRDNRLPAAKADAYAEWVKAFLNYWKGVRPSDLSDVHALLYLSHLHGERKLACAMRSQTAGALAMFYRHVLQQEVCFFTEPDFRLDPMGDCRLAS